MVTVEMRQEIYIQDGLKEMAVNPFLTSGLVHPCDLEESISSFRGFW